MALDTLTPDEWQALDQAAMAHRLTPMGGQSPSPPIPDMGGLPTISPHVVAPLPATREADIAAGTKLQPGVGKELYAGGLPSVSAEPFTPKYYEQERERSDFQHLHPMGSEVSKRPGFLGKLEHGLATAGNIAGNIVAPGTMANIPGTEMNQRLQRMGQAKGYEQAVENEQREAQTAGLEEANKEVPFTPFGETEPIPVLAKSLPTLEAAKQRAEASTGNAATRAKAAQNVAETHGKTQEEIEGKKETSTEKLLGQKGQQASQLEQQREAGATALETLRQAGRMAVTEARGALQKDAAAARTAVTKDPNKLTPPMLAMKQTAQSLIPEIERMRPKIDALAKELGPAAGRWNDFWTGKIGVADPEFATMRDELGFLETGVALAHARGRMSNIVFEHFEKMFDAGRQSPENLKAALDVAHQWMLDYSRMGEAAPTQTEGGGAASAVPSFKDWKAKHQ